MKKILPLLFIGILAYSGLYAQEQKGIIFTTDKTFDEVLAKAKAENKYVFMDAYAVWCGPCKWIAKNIFPLPEVGEYFNSRFVAVQMDMEKGEGIELNKRYDIKAFPTLLFLNSDGEMVHRIVGAVDADKLLRAAKIATDPEQNLAGMQKKYQKNKTNTTFLIEYLNLLDAAYMDKDEVLKSYFQTQKEEDLISESNWNLIKAHLTDPNSREFKYLRTNTQAFIDKYSKSAVCDKIYELFLEDMVNVLRNPNVVALYPKAKEDFDANYARRDELLAQTDMLYYQYIEKNQAKYMDAAERLMDVTQSQDPNLYNQMAWTFYQAVDDKAKLEKAKKWAAKGISIQESAAILDTYAALCKKLEQYDEALEYAEKALNKAKEEGDDLNSYEQNIEEIKEFMK